MKRTIVSATAVALLSGVLVFPSMALGQAKPAAAATQPAATKALPHKVGLVDMAYVFKNYKKFEELRADLKTEIEDSEAKMKALVEQAQQLQAKMKTFKEGSPEFNDAEKQLAKISAEGEAFRREMQRTFLKKESEIYHTVYMEVSEMVRKYAEHFEYTLVMRFTREDLNTENPNELIQGMNRQVVYFRTEDDITEGVIQSLNKRYKPAGNAAAPATNEARQPAGRVRQ